MIKYAYIGRELTIKGDPLRVNESTWYLAYSIDNRNAFSYSNDLQLAIVANARIILKHVRQSNTDHLNKFKAVKVKLTLL